MMKSDSRSRFPLHEFRSLRVAVVGLGSMGMRRLRGLERLGVRDLVVWDPRKDRVHEAVRAFSARPASDFTALLAHEPRAVIISTPPDLHTGYARQAVQAGCSFFTEASVIDDLAPLQRALRGHKGLIAAPSATLRFHPQVERMKRCLAKSVEAGRNVAFLLHCGQWLPDWHPWEDYRAFYGAKGQTGAAREMVAFELGWLTDLWGDVEWVSAVSRKMTSLEIEGKDLFLVQIGFRCGALGQMQVDIIARPAYRDLRVVGEGLTIEWSLRDARLRWKTADAHWRGDAARVPADGRDLSLIEFAYVRELRAFLAAVVGEGEYPYTLADDRAVLCTLAAVERSIRSGRRERVK